MSADFQTYQDTRDKDGFAVPASPSDALRLLNGYMRTGLLFDVQHAVQVIDEQSDQSPIYSLALALEFVSQAVTSNGLSGNITANPYCLAADHAFDPIPDARHDMELIEHHLAHIKAIIADIEETRG